MCIFNIMQPWPDPHPQEDISTGLCWRHSLSLVTGRQQETQVRRQLARLSKVSRWWKIKKAWLEEMRLAYSLGDLTTKCPGTWTEEDTRKTAGESCEVQSSANSTGCVSGAWFQKLYEGSRYCDYTAHRLREGLRAYGNVLANVSMSLKLFQNEKFLKNGPFAV